MARINLNILLASRNLSQQEFSRITNINKGTINRYCNNSCEKITLEHIDIICDYFKCRPNDLFTIPPKIITGDEALETVRKMSEAYGYNVNATDDEVNSNNIQLSIIQKLYSRFDTFLNDLLSYISKNKKDLLPNELYLLKTCEEYNSVSELQARVEMKLEICYTYLKTLLSDNINNTTNNANKNNTTIILGVLVEFRNLHYHSGLNIYQDEKIILHLQDALERQHEKFMNNEINFLD